MKAWYSPFIASLRKPNFTRKCACEIVNTLAVSTPGKLIVAVQDLNTRYEMTCMLLIQ